MLKKIISRIGKKEQTGKNEFTVLKHLHGKWNKEEVLQIMKIGASIARDMGFPEHLILLGSYAEKQIIKAFGGIEICAVTCASELEGLPFIPAGCKPA